MMQIARWGKQWDTFSSVKLPIHETGNQAYAVNLHQILILTSKLANKQ